MSDDAGSEADFPGYGPRDPREGAPSREGGLRCRFDFVAASFALGLSFPFFVVMCVLHRHPSAILEGWPFAIAGPMALYVATWYATRPLVSWDPRGIVFRHVPWRRGMRFDPSEVAWRPGATYVGRFLVASHEDGSRVRFPLWLLRRSSARRLFAYLDHVTAVTSR